MIRTQDLTKNYGERLAIKDLNFTVKKGEILGFLGPNGAGKSTTMNILAGVLAPTSGQVFLAEQELSEDPVACRQLVGYLPEQPPLYLDLSVAEYLRFVLELKQVKKEQRERQLEKVYTLLQLGKEKERLIANLSKGFKQRVGIAQALLGEPEIIILDEPSSGLDPQQMSEIRTAIKDLAKEHTVLLSSHILSEVSALCDRILLINEGQLVGEGSLSSLGQDLGQEKSYEIIVPNKAQRALTILEQLPGVLEPQIKQEQLGEIKITFQAAEDPRAAVFRAFAKERNLPLLGLRSLEPSLEEIYLELTSHSPQLTDLEEEDE